MQNRRSRVLAAAVTSASLVLLSSSVITGAAHAATSATTTTYEAESSANTLAGGANVIACAPCSGGDRVGNIGAGGTLTFNNVTEATAGTYQVVVAATQDQGRTLTAYISVNGGKTTKVLFNRTASWTTVEDMTVPMTLKAGANTIEFSNPSKNCPDIDAIMVPGGTAVGNDFSVSDSPTSGSVAAGSSTTTTVSTAVTSGSAETVALTTSGAPSGVTVSLSPASVTAGASSTLTATTTSAAAAGSYPITITGTATSGTHTATYTLNVTKPGTNGFSVSVSPASGSVAAGSSTTTTVGTAVTSGSAQTVALTTSGAPSGVTVSLSPASVTAGASSTLTATTTSAAAAGSYPITVTGTATSGTATAMYTLTVTTSGGGVTFTQADINTAVAAPLIAFAAPTTAVPRPGTNPIDMGQAATLFYLALVDKDEPSAKAASGTTVDTALLAQVRNLIAGGNEPDADGGLEGWSHAAVAQALVLVKNGKAWAELSASDQNKVSLLEAAMGYAGNYTYNDASNFASGICGFGNFSKTNNPNYEDGYVDVEAAAIGYFGASTWTSMLASFSDATEVSVLKAAGLTNAAGCYSTVGTSANTPIKRPFLFKGHPSTDLMGIWNQIADDTFDQVTTSVNGPAHIADNTTSPEQGKLGMGHEFNSTDSSGLRSSAMYVFEGWMNVTADRTTMTALGTFSCSAATSAARYNVGSLDLIYKLHHGYISQALNQDALLVDDHGDPSTDGPNVKGYQYDLDGYNMIIANQGC